MKYEVLDLETENHKIRHRTANPFYTGNYIVAAGWKIQGDPTVHSNYTQTKEERDNLYTKLGYNVYIPDDVDILVGHNIKFDLQYLWNDDNLQKFFKRGGRIYDTQYAEYLLKGMQQSVQMNRLGEVALKYGGTAKIDEVKALWDAGYLTSQIDKDLLMDYLCGDEDYGGDVGNTEISFLGQLEAVKKLGMTKMIFSRMDGLLCTTMMECNGVKVDTTVARRNLAKLIKEFGEISEKLNSYLPELPPGLEFNWGSGNHVSCVLFGGCIKFNARRPKLDEGGNQLYRKAKAQWPLFEKKMVDPADCTGDAESGYELDGIGQDRYLSGSKKGQLKWKWNNNLRGDPITTIQPCIFEVSGFTSGRDEWVTKNLDGLGKPIYSTNGEVLTALANTTDIQFCKDIERYAALTKEMGVYYIKSDKKKGWTGMLSNVDPETRLIHHNLNHTATVTARLSANNPNMQNIPRKDKSKVKEMFVSRFGPKGCCIEADYSQLEVVCQGVLSNDTQLRKDLNAKIDFHCKRVAASRGITYEDALDRCKNEDHPLYGEWGPIRTKAKIFSFQRAYGAGARLIADETGMSLEEVEDLIEAEERMYPGISAFNRAVEAEVWKTAEKWFFKDAARGFRTFQYGTHTAPTGTRYMWRTYDAPDYLRKRGKLTTFSPTELKNYPVQGFGGEVVQAILGLLFRHFVSNDNYGGKAFLTNTVHDCIWIDCHRSVAVDVGRDIKRIMESVPEYFNNRYGMKIDVPFPVDVEIGDNMQDMHHLDLTGETKYE